jgi:hypothetical protein
VDLDQGKVVWELVRVRLRAGGGVVGVQALRLRRDAVPEPKSEPQPQPYSDAKSQPIAESESESKSFPKPIAMPEGRDGDCAGDNE